jgi:hypothetical protein
MSGNGIVRVWFAAGIVIAIVLGSLAYSADVISDDAISSHIQHDFIPPFSWLKRPGNTRSNTSERYTGMYSRLVMKAWIAVIVSAIATPTLAAGSDVVHYPKLEDHQGAGTAGHYTVGVPTPRLRSFANVQWTNPIRSNDFREFHHE